MVDETWSQQPLSAVMGDADTFNTTVSGISNRVAKTTVADGLSVLSTGTTTRVSLADRFAQMVNVVDEGADSTGVVNAVTAFQAAIDNTTNGTVATIFVPAGTYAGALAALTVGTRQVVWLHLGKVTYSTSNPPGSRLFDSLGGNITRPWLVGTFGFSQNAGTSLGTSADQPALFVVGNADHTGGTVGGSVESAPFKVLHTVGDGVKNYESGITVNLNHSSDGDATNPPSMVGAHIVGRRTALGTNTAPTWGANIVARDESLRASDVQLGGVTALELNLVVSGPDVNNVRQALTIFPSSAGTSPDGASEITAAIRISPSIALGGIDIRNGLLMDVQGGGGSFTRGITLKGPFSAQAIDIDQVAQTGIIRIGGTLDAGIHSQFQFVGHDSTGARTIYSRVNARVLTNTNGAEDGRFDINTLRAGADTIEAQIAGGMKLGLPTGSFKGVGTLNAIGVYDDNVLLTCAPVEHAVSGKFDLKRWDNIAPSGKHYAAHVYDEMLKVGYQPESAADFVSWLRANGAVPGLIRPTEWLAMEASDDRPSVGEWGQRTALAIDLSALAIVDLNRRLELLEGSQ